MPNPDGKRSLLRLAAMAARVLACLPLVAATFVPGANQRGWGVKSGDRVAASLLERARSSLGGAGRWNEIRSFAISARHETWVQGVHSSGEFILWARAPDDVRIETGFEPAVQLAAIDRGLFCAGAVMRNTGRYVPSSIDTPDALRRSRLTTLRQVARLLAAWTVLVSATLGAEARDAGTWKWEGGEGPSVHVVAADGFVVGRLAFDVQSGLPRRLGFSSHRPLATTAAPGTLPTRTEETWELSDYREVAGVQLAHRLVMRQDGVPYREIAVHSFEANTRALASGPLCPAAER